MRSDDFLFNATATQVNIDDQTLVIRTVFCIACGEVRLQTFPSLHSYKLSDSPFLFSSKHNVLLAGGCGGGVVMVGEG